MQKYKLLLASGAIAVSLVTILALHSDLRHSSLAAAVASISGLTATTSPSDSNASTTVSIVDILQQLQDQELRLTTDVAGLRSQVEAARLKGIFSRSLQHGDSGDDVMTLQTLLANMPGAAATSTTGYYGSLTVKEVRNFQTTAALKATGIFDSETRDALISSALAQMDSGSSSANFTPTDLSSFTDPQQTIQTLQDQVSQLSARIADDDAKIADLQSQVTTLESGLSDIQSNVSTLASTPPPAAPVVTQPLAIASIQAGSLTKTSATITWTTNNPATGEVDYSQNSSMPVSQTLTVKSSTMTTTHSIVLPSLVSGTVYYYRVISADSSNTIANSSNLTFTTLH